MVLVVGHAMVYVVQVRGNEEKRAHNNLSP
jgi:hypothetical protein